MRFDFGFIGAGNMGGALAKAAARATKDIAVADFFQDKAKALAETLGVSASDNQHIARFSDYIFLGVKPQMMEEMLKGIRDTIKEREDAPVFVSMAAGLSIDTIRAYCENDVKVIRIMPNTPVSIGEGEILYTKSENTTEKELERFLYLMRFSGELTEIDERLMNAGCSLSGCGPAFVYLFIRALKSGGAAAGLDEEVALALAAQTVIGAAKLLKESGEDPEILIKNVCSPGGSTIEGVRSLEENGLERIVENAVKASYKRNVELGNGK